MAAKGGQFDPALLDKLREQHLLSDFFEQCGVSLRRAGGEWIGLSPFNFEKTPSFTVCDRRGFFHCFSSGQHGDIFDAVQHFKGLGFSEAVRFLGGEQEITPEDRERIQRKRREREEREEAERQRTMSRIERIFDNARSIIGTYGADYLERRILTVDPSWTFDLRFVERLVYRGFRDEDADQTEELGKFPAMLAAIRDVSGAMIGLHRTYLDNEKPVKLMPPGDRRRNRSKKILGEVTGGMIRLSEIGPRLAMGEGIETTRAWFEMSKSRSGITIASAVSLGNLAGASAGSVKHPDDNRKRVPNGEPDEDRPGVILPPHVEEVILLGDGDSDPPMTRQRLRVAGNRFRAQGREVRVHMAPKGKDFNDIRIGRAARNA